MTFDLSSLSLSATIASTDPIEAHDEAKRAYLLVADNDDVGKFIVGFLNPKYYDLSYYGDDRRALQSQANADPRFIALKAEKNEALQAWSEAKKDLDVSEFPIGSRVKFRTATSSDQWGYKNWDTEEGTVLKWTDANYIIGDVYRVDGNRRVPRVPNENYELDRQCELLWGPEGWAIESARLKAKQEADRIKREAEYAERNARYAAEEAERQKRQGWASYIGGIQDIKSEAERRALADLLVDLAPVLARYERNHLDRLMADVEQRDRPDGL